MLYMRGVVAYRKHHEMRKGHYMKVTEQVIPFWRSEATRVSELEQLNYRSYGDGSKSHQLRTNTVTNITPDRIEEKISPENLSGREKNRMFQPEH